MPIPFRPPVKGLAQGGDVHGQVHFLDECVGPHLVQQIILAHQMPAAVNENDEDIEGLRSERDRLSAAQQQALLGCQNEVAELKNPVFACIARA